MVLTLIGGDLAALAERHLRMRDVIAAMRVGEKGFRAVGGPFHRAPDAPRGPQANDLLGINENLRAEPAADIGCDHAQLVLGRHADECGDDQPRHMRILRGVPEREIAGAGIVFGDGDARLHGVGNQAIVDDVEPRDVLRAFDRRIHRLGVAEMPLIYRVPGRGLVDRRRALRLGHVDHRRQHLIVDLDLLGRVFALRGRFGDHHRDRIADIAGLARRDRRMRRHLHRRAVLGMDHPAANEIADLVGREIRAGEHGDHARHRGGRLGVDALDLGVRMRRAQEHRARFARPADVVGVLALAGDEAEVFLATHRRADSGRTHGGHSLNCLIERHAPFMARAPAAIALTMLW